jgi:geranylgeranyl reductase
VLDDFLGYMGIRTSGYRISGCPENYLFRGLKFGKIYLCGDAAGVAYPATGEGIFPAMVSGECVARDILGYRDAFAPMKPILKHRRRQLAGLELLKRLGNPALQATTLKLVFSYIKRRAGRRGNT